MAGLPVVVVDSGGMAVTISETESGFPMELATNGFGIAVTIVESGGVPVTGLGAVILLSSTTIDEDASIGDAVGTLTVSIATGNWADPITYTITADPDSKFDIDGDALEIDDTLDYDADTSHSVTIQADNGTDDPITRTFSISVNNVVSDTTPAAFSFTDLTGAGLSTVYESNTIVVSGTDGPSTVTITGGEYQKNGGAWTSAAGSAVDGDTFAVRGTSSSSSETAVNVVLSIGGNVTAATSDTYSITTADHTAPTITALSPLDNATGVAVDAVFEITFSENIVAGASASFRLYDSADTLIEEFDETDFAGAVVIADDTLTITWTDDLDVAVDYYILIDAGSVEDAAGNPFAGILTDTAWSFTSAIDALLAPTLDLTAATDDTVNGGTTSDDITSLSEIDIDVAFGTPAILDDVIELFRNGVSQGSHTIDAADILAGEYTFTGASIPGYGEYDFVLVHSRAGYADGTSAVLTVTREAESAAETGPIGLLLLMMGAGSGGGATTGPIGLLFLMQGAR